MSLKIGETVWSIVLWEDHSIVKVALPLYGGCASRAADGCVGDERRFDGLKIVVISEVETCEIECWVFDMGRGRCLGLLVSSVWM